MPTIYLILASFSNENVITNTFYFSEFYSVLLFHLSSSSSNLPQATGPTQDSKSKGLICFFNKAEYFYLC